MESKKFIALQENELAEIDGGIPPLLAWLGYTAATAVVGYFVYEATDGIVKGLSSESCSCSGN